MWILFIFISLLHFTFFKIAINVWGKGSGERANIMANKKSIRPKHFKNSFIFFFIKLRFPSENYFFCAIVVRVLLCNTSL